MAVSNYRNLVAWQRAMDLAEAAYHLTDRFPGDERFGLTSQARRAAVSVPSNIAEGHGRGTAKAILSFIRIANGSTKELETRLLLAERRRYVTAEELRPVMALADEVGRLLTGLRRALMRRS
jgi:four helix bundle protein